MCSGEECTAVCVFFLHSLRSPRCSEVFRRVSEKLLIKQLLNVAAVTHGRRGGVLFEVLVLQVVYGSTS